MLAEPWRGATAREEREFLHALARNHPILTPTQNNWLESGQLLARIFADKGFDSTKLRHLHFDVLIALASRSCGARSITSHGRDYELIRSYRSFQLEIW